MKFDLTLFDEKALKQEPKEPYSLLWKLREVIREQKTLDTDNIEHQARIAELEEDFNTILQKLVKSAMWTVLKITLQSIKDLFNVVSERLEKIKDTQNKSQILLLLQVLAQFSQYNAGQDKVDTTKCLIDIMHKEDDFKVTALVLEILQSISLKKQHEFGERACNIAIAPNLLRSKEQHFTLMEQSAGVNSNGESLINCDLIFEIESQPQGLNDRIQTKKIVIPRDQICQSSCEADQIQKQYAQTSAQLARKIAQDYGKEQESFIYKLETKIQWVRYVNSPENLKEAIKTQLSTISVACNSSDIKYLYIDSWKSDSRHTEYVQYIKESLLKECVELLTQSGDKDLIVKMLQLLNKITQKDHQGTYFNFDILTKVQNQRQNEDDVQKPFLVKVIEDISSIKVQEDGLSLIKVANTSTVGQNIAKSSQFQWQFISLTFFIMRIIQAQHNRGSTLYQDTVNMLMGSLLKIVEDTPLYQAYAYHPKVAYLASTLLKLTVRPRFEEQHEIIKKFENKIQFEVENLQTQIGICDDEEDISVEVDQKDRQMIMKNLVGILTDLISKDFITVVGAICSDNPATTPTLIKNGVFTSILSSLSQRIPNNSDMFESLIFSINQMSLHQEGQVLVLESKIFQKILAKVIDDKASQNLSSEQLLFRMHLSNLFDRNPEYKENMKDALLEYLAHIQNFVIQQNIKIVEVLRRQDINQEGKAAILYKLDQGSLYPSVQGAIVMIHNICFLSNDSMAQSRHTQDIITSQIFKRILEVFLLLGSNPYQTDILKEYLKIIRALVEHVNYVQNVQIYIDLFTTEMERFLTSLSKPLYQIQEFDFDQKEEGVELLPMEQFDITKSEQFLSKGEQLFFQISRIHSFIKANLYLHSTTQHQVCQHQAIYKIGKSIYYLLRIAMMKKIKYFARVIQDMQANQESEDYKKYGKYLMIQYNSKEQSFEDKRESIIQIKSFLQQVIDRRFYTSQLFPLRDKFLEEFINKISSSSYQQRHQHARDAIEKNLFFIGKLAYKTSKHLSKSRLTSICVEASNQELSEKLFTVHSLLSQMSYQIAHGWIDGASFYQFFKKGGILNLIECFQWLGENLSKVNQEFQQINVYLFDDCCQMIKSIMQPLIISRVSEAHVNSLMATNLGSDFDSAKNLYQTFYNQLCTKLLPLTNSEQNPLLIYQSLRCPYLQDVIMTLLQYTSKGFSNCQFIKDNIRPDRDNAGGRGAGGRGRNQVNSVHVETLYGMNMGFSRENIQQALIQTQNNVDNALFLLLEWRETGHYNQQEANNLEGISSQESDQDDPSDSIFNLDSVGKLVEEKKKKVEKVSEATFNETVRKTQQEGFKWMIQAQENQDIVHGKFKDFLIQIMLNEKQESFQKNMYAQIDELFKKNGSEFLDNLNNALQIKEEQKEKPAGDDEEMIDTTQQFAIDNKSTQMIQQMLQLQSDIQLIHRVINNNKPYLKEAVLKSDVALKSINILQVMLDKFNQQQSGKLFQDEAFAQQYQKLVLELLIFLFTIVQLSQMQITLYQASKVQIDQCQKKIKSYKIKAPTNILLKLCLSILCSYDDQVNQKEANSQSALAFKTAIPSTAASIALRILMIKDAEFTDRQENITKLFELITKFKHNTKIVDHKMLSTISILHFETNKILFSQMEKLTQRVLWLKSEYEAKTTEKKDGSNDNADQGHLLTKFSLNNFLAYFQPIQIRDPDSFKASIKENCEIKTIKKANALSQDQAVIRLKEPKFNEVKKQVLKERSLIKQIVKSIDFHKDQNLKTQTKISKKALLGQLCEQQVQAIQVLIQNAAERTSQNLEEYNEFLQAQIQQKKFIKNKNAISKNSSQDNNIYFFETIFKMTQAYPAATVAILSCHPQQNKRSFVNWFIKDFMVSQMLTKTIKDIKLPEIEQEYADSQQQEINFSLKSNLKQLDSFAFKALNHLTSYNHIMTLNEQCVKHELRTKFILESLSILSKTIKDKNTLPQPLSKCLILSSLTCLDALINFQNPSLAKQQLIIQDNFMNSIRAAILRDAQTKESNLPPSLLKLCDELLTEVIDLTLPSNAEIINKAVSILYNLGEFISTEKRKEEKAKLLAEQQIIKDREIKEGAAQDVVMNDQLQLQQIVDANLEGVHNDLIIQPNLGQEIDQDSQQSLDEEEDDILNDGHDENDDDEEDEDNDEDDDGIDGEGDEDDDDEDELINDAMDDEIDLHRQEGEHDLFEEEEDDEEQEGSEEDQEIIIHERMEGVDRRAGQPRLLDIINPIEANIRDANNIRYHGYRRHQEPQYERRNQQDWSEEEAEVQRILVNMRANHNVALDRAPRLALGGAPPAYGYHQNRPGQPGDEPGKKATLIDFMYDGLQFISDRELLDFVTNQKQILELEIREEQRVKVAQSQGGAENRAQQNNNEFLLVAESLNNARGAINALQRRIDDMGEDLIIDYDMGAGENFIPPIRMPGGDRPLQDIQFLINQGWNGRIPPPMLMDPLFARPNPFLEFPPLGGQNIFGGHQEIIPIPNQFAVSSADQQQLFNYFIRQTQTVAANQNEGLGQQLLESMDIEVEEQKEEVKQEENAGADSSQTKRRASISISSPRLSPSYQATGNAMAEMLSNEQLLATFFNRDQQQSEVEREIQRIQERSRSLRNEVERQSQDIQQIVDQQNRIQGEQIQPFQPVDQNDIVMQNEQQQQQQEQIVPQNQEQQQPMNVDNQEEQQQQQQVQEVPLILQNFQINIAEENVQEISALADIIEQEEEKLQQQNQEEQKEQIQPEASSNTTFGYDNNLLLENGIDPAILLELPEDLRAELLSTIDLPPPVQQQQQQQQQQPPSSNNNVQEEQKQDQQQPPQQQQVPVENSLANDLGIDPEFLANLPEDMQIELLQNEQFRQRNLGQQQQQQPQREAEQMDLASFIATVTDPALRREIFANMDEATIASLPPNLMAEARRFHDQIRYERVRAREQFANIDQRARGLVDQLGGRAAGGFGRDDPFGAIFGRRVPGQREENKQANVNKTLDEIITIRSKQLTEEVNYDDTTLALAHQLSNDEKILESLILILISNTSIECELIPCLQSLIKIHSTSIPVIRNKIINAITFLLKALSTNDDESVSIMFPNAQIKKKQSLLILLGSLRLLLKSNKNLMKFILKGLILKEDNLQHQKQGQILKKQLKAVKAKLGNTEVSSFDENQAKSSQSKILILPPLAEIFYLIRTDMFKNDKSLLRNLSLLIYQILKQFDIALEELETSNQAISSETVQSIAEVLSLDIIDQSLMEALGDFLFQISKKKKENFELISKYCKERSNQLLEKLTEKLGVISHTFHEIKNKISPGKMQVLEHYSPSQGGDSIYEEEKNEIMIDTSINNPLQELQKKEIRGAFIKLPEEEEKLLKSQIKVQESSEVLLRIFKLFNLFYEKFNEEKAKEEELKDQTSSELVISEIQELYKSGEISTFVNKVSEVLRIIYKTNLDVNEGVSNLIFCVFSSFYPELFQSIEHHKQSEESKNSPGTSAESSSKYQIKMLPLVDSNKRQDRFVLFRNASYFTNRVEDFSNFVLANKRIINKLIKTKTNLFANELEGLVRHMPNLLDFDNKRIYFKRELAKLKRSQYHDNQIQLFIRRDNIFMDSYAQLSIRQANEMKGRLHIQFTGERGQDAGGLTRDFFIELSREMFNPNYSLFILSSSGSTYYPNPKSYVQIDHLNYFKFIGRVIGKAIFDECLLECYFVKSLYKIMTGEPLTFQDLEDFDNEFYNNLKWCLENDVEPLYATFVTEQDFFGQSQEIELIEGGKKIPVTNDNKSEYVEKLTYFKLYKSIQKPIDAFLEGFYELIPKDLLSLFNYKELELLISGLPNFDINDLKQNTEYMGYNANSPQVLWLWEILESFENSERAEFLQFVTGSSKVPLDGFKGLIGMRGPQKFTIAKIKTDDILRLPSGHTCFNQIDMPEYPSKEIMHERLLTAIKETKGFGFA